MPTSLGPAEILVILVVALIVLGPKRLPEAGRQVGKAIAEVRKWSQSFQDEIRTVIDPNVAAPSYPAPPVAQIEPAPGLASPADAEYTGPIPGESLPAGRPLDPEFYAPVVIDEAGAPVVVESAAETVDERGSAVASDAPVGDVSESRTGDSATP